MSALRTLTTLLALPMLAALAVAAPRMVQETAAEAASHLKPEELRAIDETLQRGRDFLLAGQNESGAFPPREREEVCSVATTALALWALSRTSELTPDRAPAERAAQYLLSRVQPDGGIYDPARSLPVYTSGVAARALEAWCALAPSEDLERAWRNAELFAYRRGVPESILDENESGELPAGAAAQRAAELLREDAKLSEAEERALRFLEKLSKEGAERGPARTRAHGWRVRADGDAPFGYEDVLPIVYRPLMPEDDLARRAHAAIRREYTLDRNPDLTHRYGEGGFQQSHQGIYYYYLLLARTLFAFSSPIVRREDGEERDWVRELSRKLMALQRPEGCWTNESLRWWEGEPAIVTAYAMLALDRCRRMPGADRH